MGKSRGIREQLVMALPRAVVLDTLILLLVLGATAQAPDEGYSREQLQPLTKFRQQHRRTIDGRLCAAAFVQNRKSYTGCTDAPNPAGESGRSWCYVEAQLLDASAAEAAWNLCAPVTDYDGLRKEVAAIFADKVVEVQGLVAKLQKTQRAAEQALDKYEKTCAA